MLLPHQAKPTTSSPAMYMCMLLGLKTSAAEQSQPVPQSGQFHSRAGHKHDNLTQSNMQVEYQILSAQGLTTSQDTLEDQHWHAAPWRVAGRPRPQQQT